MISERNAKSSPEPTTRKRRDAGFTLPELLVSIIVLGSIVAVLSSTIIVTLQQRDNTEGRLNVSRAEQNISMWIPADLASAGSVPSTDPKLSPCSVDVFDTTGCPANVADLLTGSNALFLTWTDEVSTISGPVTVTTNVSYHFKPNENGLYDLLRIECSSTEGGPWTCEINTVLHDLVGPPPPDTFVPGVTKPSWVLQVSVPLPPDVIDPDAEPDPTYVDTKNASRVVVTINGGGDVDGGGGGINQISITAGGTTRNTLPPNSVQHAPTFTQTQSRCGGPITLVVDESNSVGTDISHVRNAVTAFVEALAGTPVQIQVVRFHTRASVLGDSSAWTKYYDMTNEADVTALLAAVPQLQGSWPSGSGNGGTNWEDAIFRTFYSPSDPSGAPNTVIPKTVVFFTDGVPTFDRIDHRGGGGVLTTEPALPGPGWFASAGNVYSQVAFNRADYWADIWRAADDTKLIGVGVGDDINDNSEWMENPRAGYHTGWQERSTFTYQSYWLYEQLMTFYEQLVNTWEQSTFTYEQLVPTWEQSTFTYQARYEVKNSTWGSYFYVNKAIYDTYASNRRRDNGWANVSSSVYTNYNTTNNDTDGVRRISTGTGWTTITQSVYNANNTTSDSSDGFRTNTTWSTVSQSTYNANNTTNDSTDGWRRISTGTGWTPIDQATYNANNTTSDSSDGFRVVSTWTPRTQAEYNAGNTTPDSSDGWRTTTAWTAIAPNVYNANNTTSDSSDGYRRTNTGTWNTISKAYYDGGNTTNDSTDGFRRINPSGAWVSITQAEYNARNTTSDESDGVRIGGKEYSLPYTDFEEEITEDTPNSVILARFITGNDNGVPWLGALNTNEREANMFVEPNWSLVPGALKAVALGECGATLTLQTKLGSAAAVDPFTYQNSGVSDSSGTPLEIVKKTVITNISSPARTFDFDIADGTFRTVEITPVDLSDLTGYTGGSWSCKAGVSNRPVTTFPVADSVFSGIRVVVGANEAVSCIHTVTAS